MYPKGKRKTCAIDQWITHYKIESIGHINNLLLLNKNLSSKCDVNISSSLRWNE